eukprot:4804362-Prymnesium_polylepis.1
MGALGESAGRGAAPSKFARLQALLVVLKAGPRESWALDMVLNAQHAWDDESLCVQPPLGLTPPVLPTPPCPPRASIGALLLKALGLGAAP